MSEHVEGTIVLDGLLQGRLPADDGASRLREWVEFVGSLGLKFSLEERGNAFSLLPDDAPVSIRKLGDAPEETLAQAVQQLADALPAIERGQLFSTLRSSEYRPKIEVQTIYTAADGKVHKQSRSVAADTTPPEIPVSIKERVKMAAVGVGLAGVIVGIALLFPGVRAMFGQVVDSAKPIDVNQLQVDVGPYDTWLEAKFETTQAGRGSIALTVKRKEAYPRSDEAWEAAAKAGDLTLRRRLAFENLARGYVRIDLSDDGRFIQSAELRTEGLGTRESLVAPVPLPEKIRITRFVFVP